MLTNEDIAKLIEAHKQVFPTKEDFDDLRDDFSDLQTSVDGIAKKFTDYQQELKVYQHRTNNLEGWAQKAGGKLGINYEK